MREQLSPHFRRSEFACKCKCGFATVDVDLLAALESVRNRFGEPVTINCGCRCEKHNANVGGVENSKHKLGLAVDITVKNVSPDEVYDFFDKSFPLSMGVGRYDTFTHIDVRSGIARW